MDERRECMLQVEVARSVASLPLDAVECLERLESGEDDVQLGSAWFQLLEASVYAGHPGVRYFVLRSSDQVLAVLPMLIEPCRMGNDVVALANFYTSWFCPPLSEEAGPLDLRPLLDAIRREAAPLRSIRLAPLDHDAAAFDWLRLAMEHASFRAFTFYCFGNQYLDAPDSWQAYLASRESKMRGEIKRMTKRLIERGGVIEIMSEPKDVERAVAAYNSVYARSWKVPEPHPRFIPGLASMCAERQSLRLGVASLEGTPIAAQLWIVRGNKASIFKVAYDEAYRVHSPGTVLTAAMMQWVLDKDKVKCVDFLMGDDPYKKKWMNKRRERWGIVAYDRQTVPGLLAGTWECLIRTAKRLWKKLRMPAAGPVSESHVDHGASLL